MYFWLDCLQYTYNTNPTGVILNLNYNYTGAEREKREAIEKQQSEEILAGVPAGGSDYDKVKYVFEIGTTLAGGENLTVYLAGKHGASGTQRYASFGLSAHHAEHVYLYAADGRTSDEVELPALGENGAYRWVDGAWIIDAPEDEEEAEAK